MNTDEVDERAGLAHAIERTWQHLIETLNTTHLMGLASVLDSVNKPTDEAMEHALHRLNSAWSGWHGELARALLRVQELRNAAEENIETIED